MTSKKKKIKKILHFLDTGIFPATILFSAGYSYDEIVGILKSKKKIPSYWHEAIANDKNLIDRKGSYGFGLRREIENIKTGECRTMFYIILKNKFMFTDYDYCGLAHEILHICQFALPDFLDREREYETEAYLHSHIMEQCLKALRDNKHD